MALYTRDSVERVKDAVDMVDLVGARTDLRRVGARFTGLCPFHEERTPSFSVNAEHKLYHCFGCGAGGDAVKFVEETEALDFKEALEFLAERYRVELEREQADPRAEERQRRRERLLALLERAAAYYVRYLWESGEAARAREHLLGRGLEEKVLRGFRVGYAPSAWDKLVTGAQRDGFRPDEIAAAGLGQRGRGGGFYDRFRARIMFPLADARGRVLGFGARAVREDQRPKYLNTSENELYHKGRQLFGIDRARGPAARGGRIVVVEGYTDVLALHQAGVEESVAIMGTALTQEQLAELGKAARAVHLALDADRAGEEAMLRAARSARERELELRVVELPAGKDPADLIAKEGGEAFEKRLGRTLSVPEFATRRALAGADLSSPAGRDRALQEIRPLVGATAPNSATRDELLRYVADRLDVPDAYVNTQLATARESRSAAPAGHPTPSQGTIEGTSGGGPGGGPASLLSIEAMARAERAFLSMCAGRGEVGRGYLARLRDEHFTSSLTRRAGEHLRRHFDDPLSGLPADDPPLSALVTEIAMAAGDDTASEPVLRLSFLQLERRRVERELRHAGEARERERQVALQSERGEISRQIDEVMGEAE